MQGRPPPNACETNDLQEELAVDTKRELALAVESGTKDEWDLHNLSGRRYVSEDLEEDLEARWAQLRSYLLVERSTNRKKSAEWIADSLL